MRTQPAHAGAPDTGALTVPLADDAPALPRPRSPRLVRALLLGACGAGLLGLGLPGGSPAVQALSVSPAASSTSLVEVETLHAPHFTTARAVTQRATRSRALPSKNTSARPARTAQLTGHWTRPSFSGVVSPFGMRWGRMHKGLDFGAGYGAPIRAAGDGVVVGSGYLSEESGYGIITLIRHSNGVVTAYAHQSRSFVNAGDRVAAGDTIGLVGSTGHSTGPHLHFEVRMSLHGGQINPRPWLRDHGVSV
jgi:murein DD-endopeptidase MepM/ murein hydrolase activator NlpD